MSLEEIWFRKSKIFRDEGKLQIDYVPKALPHRKDQLFKLGEYFRNFVLDPGSTSVRVILVGSIGTGKTAVSRTFGRKLEEFSRSRTKQEIKYAHVNCHAHRTLFSIMQKIAIELKLTVPRRGFSREELLYLILNYLESTDRYLIVAIDEVDYLISTSGSDALYELTRIPEITGGDKFRTGFIFIFRDLTAILRLEKSVQSTLSHNIIRFAPYTAEQLEDILWARVRDEGALYEEAVSDEVISLIAEIVGHDKGGTGDARLALEVLYRAGKYAEYEDRDIILPDDVRRAYSDVIPAFPRDVLNKLRLNEKLLLLALVKILKRKKYVTKVPVGMLELEYAELCEEYGVRPRRHTTIWDYVQRLNSMGIITAERSRKGYRGKTTLVGIPSVPLSTLEKALRRLVERDLGEGS